MENGPVVSSMRWALLGSFEHSNRELLALSICGDLTVFVVHKGSHRGAIGFPGGPRRSQGRPWGVPGTSPGVPGACPGVPGASAGVPGACLGVPWASRGHRGVPKGSPGSRNTIP